MTTNHQKLSEEEIAEARDVLVWFRSVYARGMPIKDADQGMAETLDNALRASQAENKKLADALREAVEALLVAARGPAHRHDCPQECNCWKKVFVDALASSRKVLEGR